MSKKIDEADGYQAIPEIRREHDGYFFIVRNGPFQTQAEAERFGENLMIFLQLFDRWMGAHEKEIWDRVTEGQREN